MEHQAFLRLPAADRTPAVLILEGDESFFKSEVVNSVRAALPGALFQGLAGGKTTLVRALDESRGGSLFSPCKIVYVKEADELLEEGLGELLTLKKGRSVLILDVARYGRRTKLAREAEGKLTIVSCKRLYESPPPWVKGAKPWENPLAEWALQEGLSSGLTLSLQSAFLIARIAGSPAEIRSTFQKLKTSGVETIGAAEIEALTGKGRIDEIQSLTNAVLEKDWRKAMVVLGRIFERGLLLKEEKIEDPVTIGIISLGQIWARMKEIRKLRDHLDRGGASGRETVARVAGTAPFLVERLLESVARWRREDFPAVEDSVEEADLALKGLEQRGKPRLVLEKLIVNLSLKTREAVGQS